MNTQKISTQEELNVSAEKTINKNSISNEELIKITEIPETPFKFVERKDIEESFITLGNIKLSENILFEEVYTYIDSWEFKINLIAGICAKILHEEKKLNNTKNSSL